MILISVFGCSSYPLVTMMKDQYANYVVQKMLDVVDDDQREVLVNKIRPHLQSLKKYTYGKHLIQSKHKRVLENDCYECLFYFIFFFKFTEVEKLGVTYGLQDPNEVDQIESPIAATVNDIVA